MKKSARRTRRTHAPVFEAQVSLTAPRKNKRLADLAKQFGLHPNQINDWKRQLVEHTAGPFGGGHKQAEPVDMAPLHAKIGQLTLKNDFFFGLRKLELEV